MWKTRQKIENYLVAVKVFKKQNYLFTASVLKNKPIEEDKDFESAQADRDGGP